MLSAADRGGALSGAFGLRGRVQCRGGVLQWLLVPGSLRSSASSPTPPEPARQKFRWGCRAWSWGFALWLTASLGFRLYLRYFNTYNAVYGSMGAVIILMLWFYLTGAAILVGGEVNSEIEKAAAAAGEKDAKLPGEKSPGEKAAGGGSVGATPAV